MQKTLFKITQMDCPSEENLIRMKLGDIEVVKNLSFDLQKRELTVFHAGGIDQIDSAIDSLNLGGEITSTIETEDVVFEKEEDQKRLLWIVLAINFAFFLIEMTTGLISKSMGLVADSLDMMADAFVYGISIFAIGGSVSRKKNIAKTAGYFQVLLALLGFIEVVRRFIGLEEIPVFSTMIIVSILALIANGYCLYLLQQAKSDEAHMQASMIFTSNDVIINLGIISAGGSVYLFKSALPDLIIGTIVFLLVVQGAIRILKLSK